MAQSKGNFTAVMYNNLLKQMLLNMPHLSIEQLTKEFSEVRAYIPFYMPIAYGPDWQRWSIPVALINPVQAGIYKVYDDGEDLQIYYEVTPNFDTFKNNICFLVKFKQDALVNEERLAELLEALVL